MSLPHKESKKYFQSTEDRAKSGAIVWRCNACGDEMNTGGLVDHLFRHHAPIFEDLEARRIINERKSTTKEGRSNNKDEIKAVRQCEMCGTFYDNNKLSSHKRFGELI
jgi:rubrerythrin